jgi:hypothetical protein
MTDNNEVTIIHCGGAAKPTDTHLASIVHAVDNEIISWLHQREQRRYKRERKRSSRDQ